jgi:hypothetical protein
MAVPVALVAGTASIQSTGGEADKGIAVTVRRRVVTITLAFGLLAAPVAPTGLARAD